MPNWVHNTLDVSGDAATIEKLRKQLSQTVITHYNDEKWDAETKAWVVTPDTQVCESPDLSFHNVIPIPEADASHYYLDSNWYNWNINNWGTKWDVKHDATLVDESATYLSYQFDTAWSPVFQIVEALVEQYPTVKIYYRFVEEQGWGGVRQYDNGEQTHARDWDIPNSHEAWIDVDEECVRCGWYDGDDEMLYADCPRETASV